MRARHAALLCCAALFLASTAVAAIGAGSQVKVTLKNGATITGTVVNEMSSGLLISANGKTEMVRYENITNMEDLSAPAPPVSRVEPAPQYRDAPVRQKSVEDLKRAVTIRTELRERQEDVSSAVGPVVLMSSGGVAALAGMGMFIYGLVGTGYGVCNGPAGGWMCGLGLTAIGLGAVSITVGIVMLVRNRHNDSQIRELREELREIETRADAPKWMRDLTVAAF